MSTTILKAPTRAHRRQPALDPYVERLHRHFAESEAAGLQEGIDVAGRRVVVEPWVAEELRNSLAFGLGADARFALLTQTIALRMKIVRDASHLKRELRGPTRELYVVQAELMLDAAMTMALLREIQQVIDDEVREGHMDRAKQWTLLKNSMHAAATGLKSTLADSERRRADLLTDDLTDQPATAAQTVAPSRYGPMMQKLAAQESERKRLAQVRRRALQALDHLPSRTELLVAFLAIAVAVWLGFVKLPEHFRTPLPVLAVKDFPRSDGFLEIEARPPSLYVTLDSATWSALGREQRTRLVRTASSVLLTNEYTGAWMRTEDGRPVAQWLSGSGVQLLEEDELREQPAAEPTDQLVPGDG